MRRDSNLDMDKSFINIINLIVDHKLCSMHCTSLFFTQTSMGKLPVRSGQISLFVIHVQLHVFAMTFNFDI